MNDRDVEQIYNHSIISDSKIDNLGKLTEKDKMIAAKQILLGIALLWAFAMLLASLIPTESSQSLLEVCKTALPPLATLIIAFYFKEKGY